MFYSCRSNSYCNTKKVFIDVTTAIPSDKRSVLKVGETVFKYDVQGIGGLQVDVVVGDSGQIEYRTELSVNEKTGAAAGAAATAAVMMAAAIAGSPVIIPVSTLLSVFGTAAAAN